MADHSKFLIVVAGPTAIGKSALAIELAKHFGTEIVSADSRQFYRELNAGTAKPSAAQLKEVHHYLVNSRSIHDDYNAGQFEVDAIRCVDEIFLSNKTAILCGGSGLYMNMVCNGSDKLPPQNPLIRKELDQLRSEKGIEALREKLLLLDPEHYRAIDLNNPHRLIRALEVCMVTGKKYSQLRQGKKVKRNFQVIKVGLEDEREKVYSRIHSRVDDMMSAGLLEEARTLFSFRTLNSLKAVGYSELFSYLENKISLEEAVNLIRQHTRNYAKRQWTWFRKDKEIKWFMPGEEEDIISYISRKIG